MTHQKRLSAPKSWPIERKNVVFTVGPQAGPHDSEAVPVVVFVRDVLGYADSADEVRTALRHGDVYVNGDEVHDEHRPIGIFDIVAFPTRDEYYRVFPGEGGRLALVPIEEEAAEDKLARIDDKTDVEGRVQLNLHDGGNLVVESDDYEAFDSVVVGLESGEVVEHFKFEEGCAVTAVDGQHSGEVGSLLDVRVTEGSSPNTVSVERTDGSVFETVRDYVFVIGEDVKSLEEQEEVE